MRDEYDARTPVEIPQPSKLILWVLAAIVTWFIIGAMLWGYL